MSTSHSVETWTPGLAVGQYTLVRELARGGMGEIWLARQVAAAGFNRLVVLKRVIASDDEDAAAITMFLDEARIASQLHHPNIVQVYELGQHGTSYYLAMEYLAGQTVSRLARRSLETTKRVPHWLAVRLVELAAKGLGYAHQRTDLEGHALHIVHRDVSPQNLYVTYDGQLKVLDFGIARAAGRLVRTSTGVVKGKLAYMSPEQATGGTVSGASDVFSLGIVLFELVTGSRAYRNLEDIDILRRLSERQPLPKASERIETEPELEALIARAVDPAAANRFSDGQAFSEALEDWARTHPAPEEEKLEAVMQRLFAREVQDLGEFHKLAARTPSAVSMPDLVSRTVVPRPGRQIAFIAAGVAALAMFITGALLTLRAPAPQPAPPPPEPVARAADPAPAVVPDAAVAAAEVEPVHSDPDPAKESPPERRAAGPSRAATGRLTLETNPWTRVYLGKHKLGDTPLIEVSLPAGTVSLRLVNEQEHVDQVVVIPIKANELTVRDLAF